MSNDLAYNSIDELDKAYALDKTLEFNKPAVCNTLLKLYDQGNKSLNLGDEEKSYGCLMRFVDGSMKLRKSNLYKDDPGYVETMIPKDKIATTLGKLETLKKSLRIRYEMKGLDSKLPKDEKQPTPAANKSVNPTKPGVNSSSARKAITPQELLEMLTRSTDKILIIDTRSKSEFSNSQMNFSIQLSSDKKRQEQISYINIPNEFVDGVTWNIMDKLSGENAAAAKIFGNRKAFDQLVLLDSASHFNNLTRESKLLILKRAIYEFDQDEKLSNEPLILDGGFSQWLVFYPGFTTNTAVTASSNIATIKIQPEQHSSIKKLISFDYPELEIKPKPPPVISPLTAVTPIVTTSVKDNADEQLAVSNDSRNVESDSKPVIKDDKSSTLFESAANKPPQQPAQNNSLQQHKMPNFDRSNKPSNKAIITIPSSSSDEKLTLIPPKATFEVGLSDDEENTEPTFPKLSNQKPVERNENNTQYQNDFAQLNLNKEPSQQNANSNNTLKINIGKPNLVKPAEVANDSELNSEILRSVYHTTRRPTQMPYMNGASKVLDVRTGIYTTYIPASKMSSVPGNNSTAAQLPDEPTELKFVPPRPKKEPLQKKMDQPKASKFAGSSLKRTVSSPNIDKLDDEIVDETAHNELESKANVQSFFKKQDPRPTLPSPLPQFNTTPVAATLTASQKPTIPAPNVNRNNKPLPDHEIQMRIRDLQPVYGSARQGLVGVRNLGNTCFMNSVLQCLLSTRKLVTYFVKDQYKLDLNRDNHLGFGGQIADEYAVIVRAVWDGQCRIIAPRRFKALIGQFNEQFVSNDQQDAQEFLLFLLDGLHEDLNRVLKRPKIMSKEDDELTLPDREAANQAWNIHLSINNSIIVDLFQGQFKSTVTCMTCNKKSVKFDAFMYLTLPLPSGKSHIYQCIDLFLQPEKMAGESKWKCPQCKAYRDAVKKIDIWRLPPLLIIHLKRFKYQGIWRDKITTLVDFPIENLDMNRYILNTAATTTNSGYNLYATSNHSGTLDGGHYTALCRHFQFDKWFKFDDTEVKDVSSSSLVSPTSYILFYARN